MSDELKQTKPSVTVWATIISMTILALMEVVEPILFLDEKYSSWRVVKISILLIVILVSVAAGRKKYA
jgi:hypothetical protein